MEFKNPGLELKGAKILCVSVVAMVLLSSLENLREIVGIFAYWVMIFVPFILILARKLKTRSLFFSTENMEKQWRVMLVFFLLYMASFITSWLVSDIFAVSSFLKYSALAALLAILVVLQPSIDMIVKGLKIASVFSLVVLWGLILFRWQEGLHFYPGRFGTAVAFPGILWKVGIYLMPWAVLAVFKKANLKHVFWFIVAMSLIVLDGSRTGFLFTILIIPVMGLMSRFVIKEGGSFWLKAGCMLAVILLVSSVAKPILWQATNDWLTASSSSLDSSLPERANTAEYVLSADVTRLDMLLSGIYQAVDNFPWGGGVLSTTVPAYGIDMVIHMAYLQVLSDQGVAGFVGFSGLFFIPLLVFFKKIRGQCLDAKSLRANTIAIAIVMIYAGHGLFHPVSNTISEWGVVLLAMAVLINKSESVRV
ncbi:hypothetical protein ACRYJU_06860 [Alloalcanivorax xenomutans]|uniref:hypothetical protein n=1 Tax=Alloalcanivorax xenomutans TaxID=1094342 RepID=UPI003D9B26B3